MMFILIYLPSSHNLHITVYDFNSRLDVIDNERRDDLVDIVNTGLCIFCIHNERTMVWVLFGLINTYSF